MATSNHDEFPGEVAQPYVGPEGGSSYFGTLLDSATDYAIIATDEHGLITTWNSGACNVLGWSEDEALGQSAAMIFTPEDRASGAHDQEMVRARQNGRAIDERWHIKKDGTRFWASGVLMPVRSEPGGFLKILRDLTETKHQRMAAEQASDRADRLLTEQGVQTKTLETLLSTGVRIASELDLDKLLQTVTDAGVELTGAQFGAFFYNTTDESGGKYMLYTLSGAQRSQFENFGMPRATQVFAPTFRGEGIIRSDDILADPRYGKNTPHSGMPKGHLPVRSYLAVPVYSRTREVIGGLFFGHSDPAVFKKPHEDLVTGIAAQAAIAVDNARLFRDTRRLNDTLEARVAERTAERDRIWRLSTDMMLVASFDGTIESINPAWTDLLGWQQDELIGRRFFDFVHPEDREATSKEAENLAAGLRTERFENRYRMKSGNYVWVSWIAFPEGEFIHAIGRDVSAEKAAQAELATAH
ncbi:MAG: hybrid sensor histidine kinase/response regulator, partial [Hyphomicrobiales bacterium]|nr:hybrid sensor histidine kinase/response regulator [Hyphomicrobiales bacterium]